MGKLGDKAVGSIVKIKEDGEPQEYIIVHQGSPDTGNMYDESCTGTWLLRKLLIEKPVAWNTNGSNQLENSEIQTWLNDTVLKQFDESIQRAIKTVKIPYVRNKDEHTWENMWGQNGLSCKLFLLAGNEMGCGGTNDGIKLDYFENGDTIQARKLRSNVRNYYTRSIERTSDTDIKYITADGYMRTSHANTGGIYQRWAFIMPDSTLVDDENTVFVNTAPSTPSNIQVPSTIRAGQRITISWGASTDSDGNLKGYELERRLDAGSWTSVYSGSSLSTTDTVPAGTNSVTYRVKAYDSLGLESSYNTSASRGVINNKAPVIDSETGQDLGEKNEPFSFTYTITDADNDSVTVKEWLNGKEKRSYTATLGQEETFSVAAYYGEIANGKHTLKVTASDGTATAEKVWTFIKRISAGEIRNLTLLEGLKKVAFTGSYNDLSNKPTIPAKTTVVNSLTSTSTTSALSANQGKVLNEKIPTVVDNLNSALPSSALSANQGKVLRLLIEDAVADSKIVTGIYIGNGNASRSFSLGFRPTLVIVSSEYGLWSERAAIAIPNLPIGSPSTLLSITSTGFTVYKDADALTNMVDKKYFYAAWR